MSIFIKNAEVERKARELAELRKTSLTRAIGDALERELIAARRAAIPKRKNTVEQMRAATAEFRRAVGLERQLVAPITKAEWDAMWPLGIEEVDEV